MKKIKKQTLISVTFVFVILLLSGCASEKYLLDEPVNDPIMTFEDQQDADICQVEDGGLAGASGECPT